MGKYSRTDVIKTELSNTVVEKTITTGVQFTLLSSKQHNSTDELCNHIDNSVGGCVLQWEQGVIVIHVHITEDMTRSGIRLDMQQQHTFFISTPPRPYLQPNSVWLGRDVFGNVLWRWVWLCFGLCGSVAGVDDGYSCFESYNTTTQLPEFNVWLPVHQKLTMIHTTVSCAVPN